MKNNSLNTLPLALLIGKDALKEKKLAKMGLITVQDLLLHLPLRYEDHTHLFAIKNLPHGFNVTVKGEVLHCTFITLNNRRMTIYKISDGSGILTLRFFNINSAMKKILTVGNYIVAYGKTKRSKYGTEMIHPKCRIQNDHNPIKLDKTLTPIYSTACGIKQKTLRHLIDQALDLLESFSPTELLPYEVARCLMTLPEALRTLHHPPSTLRVSDLRNSFHPARKRLVLEEMVAHNLSMLALRSGIRRFHAHPISERRELQQKLLDSLPFKPTHAQIRVVSEIEHDMKADIPMMRLIQGDVGSGKTLVAALAALSAISNGKQVALMAPTELLTEQHACNIQNWFMPLGIKIGWLVGKQKKQLRLEQLEEISNGTMQMVIGTHAIFQKQVKFNNLALVIIDEQHRFGVHQRLALWEKGFQNGIYPHQLIMTATPIPRTLAMIAYADLDASIIDELPPGRASVTTIIIPDIRRHDIIDRVHNACIHEGRQAYWVCALIEESSSLEVQSAELTWEKLQLALPKLKIGLLHGRMKQKKKQEVMQNFKRGKLHLLVATTVIEVGMDVPNASIIIIENSERLGLSQLHQLRGRVGRSVVPSHCVLLYKSPLSKIAKKRLQVLRDNNDGFVIAKNDMEIRGPGEILGTRQTGNTEFKIADLIRDQVLIPKIQYIAKYMHENYPDKAAELINRWIPETERYSNA